MKEKSTSTVVSESDISLIAGRGTKTTGGGSGGHYWNIFCEEKKAGKVFINLINVEPLGEHPSLQIFLNKASQGKHIGRYAYGKACELSSYDQVFAYMSKKKRSFYKSSKGRRICRGSLYYNKTGNYAVDSKKTINDSALIANTYSDRTGTYSVDSLLAWVNDNHIRCGRLKVKEFLPYVQLDTWGDSSCDPTSNLKHFMEDKSTRERVLQADLSYPIIVTNDNRVIDGIHRIFKALYEGQETISSIFIDQSVLNTFKISINKGLPQTGLHLPIPDLYLRVPKSHLPVDKNQRRNILEAYFVDHLPSITEEDDEWLIRLERPQEQYGCYTHDPSIYLGLEWWGTGTQISDIPFQKKLFSKGMLAIEDQWMPYSWSRFFQKQGKIPEELILLHMDDHQDMMAPRIGRKFDGKLFDYITGNSLSLDDPLSIEAAILSGAIGKGSILLPLIWSVEKIHVRHICFRPHAHPYYHIQRIMCQDGILSKIDNRISAHLEPTCLETLCSASNYVVTPNVDEWLKNLPQDLPIFLHIDMDYFNDRFDGNSNWKKENMRIHDTTLEAQLEKINLVFSKLKKKNLIERIVDTSIGISPGFYPAEFWSSTVPAVLKACETSGIKL